VAVVVVVVTVVVVAVVAITSFLSPTVAVPGALLLVSMPLFVIFVIPVTSYHLKI
jgi:hypothetical protein